jgi:hypothetical protein
LIRKDSRKNLANKASQSSKRAWKDKG